MIFKPFLFSAALLVSTACFAQEYEKNGQPCVAEICLGDGLDTIAKVKWDTAVSGFRVNNKYPPIAGGKASDVDVKRLKTTYPEANAAQAPYLQAAKFDNVALPLLEKLTVQCMNGHLEGRYTTESGNPTLVGISLVSDPGDSSKQRWVVTSILRKFPAAVTNQQKAELRAQLQERYVNHGVWNRKLGKRKPGQPLVSIQGGGGLNLVISSNPGVEEAERRKQLSQCGGGKKLTID